MRKERQRLNIRLEAEEFTRVEALAQKGGFKSACAFVRALLTQVAQYAASREMSAQELARQPTTLTAEINEMFSELLTWDAATPAEKRAAIYANEKHENR